MTAVLMWTGLWLVACSSKPVEPPPSVRVSSTYADASSRDVERSLAVPLESELLGVPGVASVRSTSRAGLVELDVVFRPETDVWAARSLVLEQITSVQLPEAADHPVLYPAVSQGSVRRIALLSDSNSHQEATLRAEALRRDLLSVPGIADVQVTGGVSSELLIEVDSARAGAFGLDLETVLDAVAQVQARGVDDMGKTVVLHADGVPVRLGDVASISIRPAMAGSRVWLNGQPTVLLTLHSQRGVSLPSRELDVLLSKSSAEIVDAPDLTVHVDIDGPGFERYAATIQSDWVLAEWNADIGGRLMIGAATKAERAEVREQVEATPIAARIHGDLPESTVVVTGPDLEQLAVLSEQLGSAFRELEGVHAVQDDVRQVATSSFRVDRHALAKFGLQHEQVRRAAAAADGGVEVDSVVRGVDGLPIRVRTTDAMLVAPNGDLMHLSAVVAHTRSTGPAVIQRINGRRAVTLTVQVRGEVSLAKVQQALRALIADVGLPVGYAVTIE